jgi:M6 family metalloprotease-like protein
LVVLKKQGYDFEGQKAKLDMNSDGIIDHVMIIHAGGAQENGSTNDIWSHMWKIINGSDDDDHIAGDTPDGEQASASLRAVNYTCFSNSSPLGIMCHEFGHDLGLVDLYAVNYSSNGVGDWAIMCTGCWDGPNYNGTSPSYFCAHSRYYLGWVNPIDISGDEGNFTLTPVEASNDKIYRISLSDTEYFLVENREKMGSDSYLPGSGMLIWHIDENILKDNWQSNTVNTNPSHLGIGLVQADGKRELELRRDRGDDGDPFPGSSSNTSFSPSTNPSSASFYSEIKSSIFLSSIAKSGNDITFSKKGSFGYIAGIIPYPIDNNLIFVVIRTTSAPDSIPSLTLNENGNSTSILLNKLDTTLFEGTYEVSDINNNITLNISSYVNGTVKNASLTFSSSDSTKSIYMGPKK